MVEVNWERGKSRGRREGRRTERGRGTATQIQPAVVSQWKYRGGGSDMEMTRPAQSTLSHHYWLMCVQTISYSRCWLPPLSSIFLIWLFISSAPDSQRVIYYLCPCRQCVCVHAETDTIRSVFMACYTAAVTGSRAFDTFLHSVVHPCSSGIQTTALAPTPSNVVLFGGQKDNLALTASATDWL